MSDRKKFIWIVAAFLFFYFLPADNPRVHSAAIEAFAMLHEYAREHVLLCLVPAFFIAGAISVFVSQQSVMKYLETRRKDRFILCRCCFRHYPCGLFMHRPSSFAGIYSRGAGIGPCVCLSLFRPGHQHPRHYIDSPSSWF